MASAETEKPMVFWGHLSTMKTFLKLTLLTLIVFPPWLVLGQRKQGNPLDRLAKEMEIITYFGERADISPDNQRIAFMGKSFGDAFVIDLKSRSIRCLTCNVPGAAFLRVMHLSNGNYILIGPERFIDIDTSRLRDNELWYLSSKPGSKPVKLGQRLFEGAAISKRSLKIAWSETPAQFPEMPIFFSWTGLAIRSIGFSHSKLMVANLDDSGDLPKLAAKEVVYESPSTNCTIEAQDFYDDDSKMTFTCYEPKGLLASVMSIDLKTRVVTNMSKAAGTYNECEGIFPGGKYTCVEADRQIENLGGEHGGHQIDIWKLRLDGTGKDFQRLTYFNDYEGWKASNPVVSSDGRFMAFQVAHSADEAGVGYGIVLLHFDK